MAKEVKVRFDKGLKKYHIEYHRLKNKDQYRYDFMAKLNTTEQFAVLVETHLGSKTKPDQMNYSRTIEALFAKYGLVYQVRPIEIQAQKQLLGFLSGGKKTETHYAITFIIPEGALNKEMFEDLLGEYDLQIGYKFQKETSEFFEDMLKGYVNNVFDESYFGNSFYDSRIFDKFLATEDLTQV